MSTPTTNFALGKGVDADNAEVYLTVTLAAALDTIDTNLRTVTGGFTVTTGGLTVTAGTVGIGAAAATQIGLYVTGAILSGATAQYGVDVTATGSSAGTSEITGVNSIPVTQATSFTVTTVAGFHAGNPVKGAGSTITSAYGLLVDPVTSGNTNNYGLYVGTPSGGSGANIGLYLGGGLPALAFGGANPVITGGSASLYFQNNANTVANMHLPDGGGLVIDRGTVTYTAPPAFVAGDKYLVIDSSGNIHKSAIGPAS